MTKPIAPFIFSTFSKYRWDDKKKSFRMIILPCYLKRKRNDL